MRGAFRPITTNEAGEFAAYVVEPDGDGRNGIMVIQEVFGVNAYIRSVADGFAEQGYRVAAPELFWRLEPRVALDSTIPEERDRAMALAGKHDWGRGAVDCKTALTFLQESCDKVGVVGFCLGGRMAYHMAAEAGASASVGYYGVGIETKLNLAGEEMAPLLLHFGETDEHCDAKARAATYQVLDPLPQVELYTYEGVGHAFARPNSMNYNAEAAALANQRTTDFLDRYLA
jgi:carboxymethylenebutenolidase